MAHARRAYGQGKWEEVRTILEGFRLPDDIFAVEYRFLLGKTTLQAAGEAIKQRKLLYAKSLLMDMETVSAEFGELERQRILLLASIAEEGFIRLCRKLPSLDEELLVRAKAAWEEKQWDRGLALLVAMEQQNSPAVHLLAGKLLLGKEDFRAASERLMLAEESIPKETALLLETCFRELGDFKRAYEYACKQR
jgi:hypothetical protein